MRYRIKTKIGFVQTWGEFGVVFTEAKSNALIFKDKESAEEVRALLEERHLVHRFEIVEG